MARELFMKAQPLPHFNEVDECAGLDGLVTNRVWQALGYPPENTLHDLRYGEEYNGANLSGSSKFQERVPPAHLIGGYGRRGQRTPAADVFPSGRWHCKGRWQARRDRLEPRLHRRWQIEG